MSKDNAVRPAKPCQDPAVAANYVGYLGIAYFVLLSVFIFLHPFQVYRKRPEIHP
jgi:hypothetical protein